MFEKLFGKVSDVVYHTIGPYAAGRRQFLEHCRQQGYRKHYLKQIAGVFLSAASDLHAHGGLDVDRDRLEAALARLETIRAEAGFRRAARSVPSLASKRVSPHVIRHTTAVHLLRAGVNINTIRAWLGHVSLDTTNIYAEVDLAMKAKALSMCSVPGTPRRSCHAQPGLMAFLRSL